MSVLDEPVRNAVLSSPPKEAWERMCSTLWETFSAPLPPHHPETEVARRERVVGPLELLLSSSAWELWAAFEKVVPRASQALIEFWQTTGSGRAILILDAVSLRESAWLLQEAKQRGYKLHRASAYGSEIPSDTTSFARALGFSQRSALENNGGGNAHRLPKARTESTDAAWDGCHDWIGASPDIVLWHHWLDQRIHQLSEPGDGFHRLCREAQTQLTSDGFWKLVEHMTTGRRLVITSDHGYAASGLFPDVADKDQANWLKQTFSSQRFAKKAPAAQTWVPPIALQLLSEHGSNHFVLGRRKWKSAGGYPTLAHGGLSLLEVAVPLIELSR